MGPNAIISVLMRKRQREIPHADRSQCKDGGRDGVDEHKECGATGSGKRQGTDFPLELLEGA